MVEQLLQLKNAYKAETGTDYVVPGAAPAPTAKPTTANATSASGGSKSKPATTATTTAAKTTDDSKKKDKSTATTTPAAPSKTVTSASTSNTTSILPTLESLVENGNINKNKLNERLSFYSYVTGFSPTKDDVRIFNLIKSGTELEKLANAARWYRQVSSFSPAERLSW